MDLLKTGEKKVLIIHNDISICKIFRDMIAQSEVCGADKINIANSIKEAVGCLDEKEYNVVICQVGWSMDFAAPIVGVLIDQGLRDKLKLILVTGGGEDFAAQAANELGADAWLSTPVSMEEFVQKVLE